MLPWEDRDDSGDQTEQSLGLKQMLVPIIAGILSAFRRVIARRVSIKVIMVTESDVYFLGVSCFVCILVLTLNILCLQNQLKRRLHAITIASATCFMFPIAMWDIIIVSSIMPFTKVLLVYAFSNVYDSRSMYACTYCGFGLIDVC